MDFAQQQRSPARHLTGIGIVILVHVLVVYALVTGLARKAIEVIKQPLETKIIEEMKKPPPPETPPPPPPKLAVPPPPFIPPPEINVQVSSPPQSTIAAVTNVAPPPTTPAVVPVPPRPAPTSAVGIACPNSQKVRSEIAYPREAQRMELTGEVLVEFTVDGNGKIRDAQVMRSSNKIFDRAALGAVQQFACIGQGQDVRVQVPFVFRLEK